MKTRYSNKLLHPNWQKKRLEILQRDNWSCQHCKETERTLHVHHSIYLNGKEPWEYPDFVFKTLCDNCHLEEHESWGGQYEEFLILSARASLTVKEREALPYLLKADKQFIQSLKALINGTNKDS